MSELTKLLNNPDVPVEVKAKLVIIRHHYGATAPRTTGKKQGLSPSAAYFVHYTQDKLADFLDNKNKSDGESKSDAPKQENDQNQIVEEKVISFETALKLLNQWPSEVSTQKFQEKVIAYDAAKKQNQALFQSGGVKNGKPVAPRKYWEVMNKYSFDYYSQKLSIILYTKAKHKDGTEFDKVVKKIATKPYNTIQKPSQTLEDKVEAVVKKTTIYEMVPNSKGKSQEGINNATSFTSEDDGDQ